MSKRKSDSVTAEADAERDRKRVKKEKKHKAASSDADTVHHVEDLDVQKKALKRAKKEQAKADVAETSEQSTPDQEAIAKAQRKALRRAEKAARKGEKATSTNGSIDAHDGVAPHTNGAASALKPAPARQTDSGYTEHKELAELPQNEIDKFILDKQLAIEDPLKHLYRPIVSFKYLPVGDDQRAPFAAFSAPTPIQAACWPYLFAGRDAIGVAETGSGKTLAFGVPCIRSISQLGKQQRQRIKSCIVSPTRELAMQIYEQLAKLAAPFGLKVTCVYGGVNKDEQRATLRGTHIVVATPGRLNDFIQEGSIDLSAVSYLVLDEADRMLDKGFEDEVRRILSGTPSVGRQTLMFTATWPTSIRELASTFMKDPVKITIGGNASGDLRANARIVQEVQIVDEMEKQGRLLDLLRQYQSGKNKKDRILVFCLYKKEATRIEEFIRRKGIPVAGIHGDLNQHKRTESLDAFKQGTVPLLVATDVAARGLDIPAVKLVINVTFPLTVEDYVHRIGRYGLDYPPRWREGSS